MANARYLVAGVGAGALVLPVELIALGTTNVDVVWTVTALLLSLGLAIGAVIAAGEYIVRRFELSAVPAGLVRGATAIPAFAFVARSLFDGGYAAMTI